MMSALVEEADTAEPAARLTAATVPLMGLVRVAPPTF